VAKNPSKCICADCSDPDRKKKQAAKSKAKKKSQAAMSPMARKAMAKAFRPGRKAGKKAAADRRALEPAKQPPPAKVVRGGLPGLGK
jgi:hypothetical protein